MKKNKIGCVIAYDDNHNNYGTALVGYALVKKVQDLGYDAEIIRYKKNLSLFEKLKLVMMMFKVGQTERLTRTLKEIFNKTKKVEYSENMALRTVAVNEYKVKKLIPLFRVFEGFESLSEGSKEYGLIVVGSDQVWTPMSLYTRFFNLLFVSDLIPKMSYASSFGVSQIPDFQRGDTRSYLNRFSRIGVRELRGKEIVEEISDKSATVVADPTILLSREEWEEEIADSNISISEPYIFTYFLGTNQESRQAVNELKLKTGLKVVAIKHVDEYVKEDEFFGDEEPYNVSPNDFVKYIRNAEYVCTDSFHCTIFSVIFNRKFTTFYRFSSTSKNSRNSRIDSLLELLNLQDRLFDGKIYDQMNRDINYKSDVDLRLNSFRENSLSFLKDGLSLSRRN